ncbi:MAG: tetratricopeptide repeat protein [Deltaproteobacteria bacterium]|nr:tetratricopeptide repeat protein [Deltaproteobacteria bacterium]
MRRPLMIAIALCAWAVAWAQEEPAVDDQLTGPIPEEVEAFKATQARFAARMAELEQDTRTFVDLRESEERARLSAGYDDLLTSLVDLEASHRALAIEEMEGFLKRYPDARYSSHVRFRLADFYFEEAKDAWLEAAQAYAMLEEELGFERMDELPPMPTIDLQKAIDLYQRIVADNRDLPRESQYEPLDAVFYMLGFSYNEPNSAQKDEALARQAFEDLVAARPDSDLAEPAHLFLGNMHFDKNQFPEAIAEYRLVFDRGEEGLYYAEALYQLAWAYYKLAGPRETKLSMGPEAYDDAMDLFIGLLDQSEEEYEQTGRQSDFRPDAVKYMAISFFDVADNTDVDPVQVAEAYFGRVGARPYEQEIYIALAEVLQTQARWDEAIAVYRKLQDDPRWVNHPDNPKFQMQIVRLYASKRPPALQESAAARVELTDRYNTEAEWWDANGESPDALATARGYIEESLADVAIEYRLKANRTGAHEDYLEAAKRFRQYLVKFPISDDYYEVQWYLADTLYRAVEYEDALVEYESLIKSGAHHAYADGSVYFAMDAALQVLQQEHTPPAVPETALVADLLEQARGQQAPAWMVPKTAAFERSYATPSGTDISVYALSEDHQRFVVNAERLQQYTFTPPQDEDTNDFGAVFAERRHKVEYLVAQMLYFHNRYDEARPLLTSLIDRYPHRNEAAYAAGLLVDSYQTEGDLAQVRLYTRKFMTSVLGEDEALIGERQQQFATLLEGAAFKEALAYVESGDRQAAAEAFVAFTEEFPGSEHVPAALYNAANSYELLGKAEKANELFEEYVERYPNDERSKALYFRIAANYESTFELAKAVDYYERLVVRFPKDLDAADALYNAAFLRIGLGDHEGAAKGFERYASQFREASDREGVHFQAGEQWEQVGSYQARRFYEGYLRTYGLSNPDHALEAKYKLAKQHLEAGSQRRHRAYLDEILRDFDRLAASGAELGWGSRHYAAEAAFVQLQEEYDRFTSDTLSGREDKDLELLMDKKPAELSKLEEQGLGIVRRYSDFEYSTASLYLVAAAYLYYADLGFKLEPPSTMSPEEQDVYWEVLETEVFPQFYTVQDKAIARFEALIKLAREQKLYSEWVGKAHVGLNDLDPRGYPKEKPEIQGESAAEITPDIVPRRIQEEIPWGGDPGTGEAP